MQTGNSDFTLTFRNLRNLLKKSQESKWFSLFSNPKNPELQNWSKIWKNRIELNESTKAAITQRINNNNPAIIPRNHLIEQCISSSLKGDLSRFHRLIKALELPFTDQAEFYDLTKPPEENEIVYQTFCGT